MEKLSVLVLAAILATTPLHAQQLQSDTRPGRISIGELQMETYDKDPDAAAVILYEDVYITYELEKAIKRLYNYRVRIKVLKSEGTSYANVSLPYTEAVANKESIGGLDAVAYNLEGDKIVKTPLKKQYVFREEVSEKGRLLKFSIPEVKVGTVIEYRYELRSDFFYDIPSIRFQHDIPVMKGYYETVIPEFFRFNISMKGYLKIGYRETSSSGTLGGGTSNPYTYSNRNLICETTDIPALKSEPFVWCLNDYRSMLDFEISQIAMPYSLIRNYSTSWADVNTTLFKSTFDSHAKIGNPFKEEVAAIIAQKGTQTETAHAILKLVQSKMKWDETYRLFSTGPRTAAGKGSGSSADINFVLMAALRDAGFKPVPILLNPRHYGRLPYSRATIDGVGAFVVRTEFDDGTIAYMDGTNPCSDLNILPSELLVDRARIYGVNGDPGWCDLTNISQGLTSANMLLKLNGDGSVTGSVVESYTNQEAMTISEKYNRAKSQEEFIQDLEKENGIEMTEVEIQGIGTGNVKQTYTLTQHPNSTDEYIYLNATCLPFMSTNELNAQSRLLPVEFSHPVIYQIRYSIELPQGYTVEELPKSINMAVCENGMRCRFIIQQAGNTIQAAFTFTQSRIVYPASEYADLSAFFGMVTDLSNRKIVIKKQ